MLQYAMPGKKLLFMGGEFGQFAEWNFKTSIDWMLLDYEHHAALREFVKALNMTYRANSPLFEIDDSWDGFEWINCITPDCCMLSYIRKAEKPEDMLVIVANFANKAQQFRVGVPYEGKYKEILNTDAKAYGGSDDVNREICHTTEIEWDGKPYAIDMVSAPLSISIFSYTPYTKAEKEEIERERAEKLRLEKEAEERRLAAEEMERAVRAAEEAKRLAESAVAEAEEQARQAAKRIEERKQEAVQLEKIAKEAEKNLELLAEKQKKEHEERQQVKNNSVKKPASKKKAEQKRR